MKTNLCFDCFVRQFTPEPVSRFVCDLKPDRIQFTLRGGDEEGDFLMATPLWAARRNDRAEWLVGITSGEILRMTDKQISNLLE